MTDETDSGEQQQTDEQAAEPEAQPAKAEPAPVTREEFDTVRVALTQIAAAVLRQPQQQQPVTLKAVEPDLQELADRHGKPVDEFRAVDGLIGARLAPLMEEVKAIRAASELTPNEMAQALMDEFGITRGAAVHALVDAEDALGNSATNKRILSRAMSDAKKQATTPEQSHTAVVRGGSLPPGRRTAAPAVKHETLVETIKKDQRKRGLYAY